MRHVGNAEWRAPVQGALVEVVEVGFIGLGWHVVRLIGLCGYAAAPGATLSWLTAICFAFVAFV